MSMLDYRGLAALDAVIEQGSFDRAAEALSISQPAISHRLRTLEESVGEVLVVRSQPPRATASGHRLIAHYRQVQMLESELNLQPSDNGLPPRLAIAVNADSAATWLLTALAELLGEPECLVEVLVDDQEQTLRHLREGRVIGCVTASRHAVAGTSVTPLGSMVYRCVASPAFEARWFANGVGDAVAARAPALFYNRSDTLHSLYLRQMGLPGSVPHHFFPSAEGFVTFIKAGFGYGVVPDKQVADEIKAGNLVEVFPGSTLRMPLYWHQWNIQTKLTKALSEAIIRACTDWLVRPE